MTRTLVQIEDVDVFYQETQVLKKVNLQVNELDFIGIIGPNGGGKTTLVKILMGILKPKRGQVHFHLDHGQVGYLPQGNPVDGQFPITVKEVVASGLSRRSRIRNILNASDREQVNRILERLGLGELKDRPIGDLSGGELQRTMLARAIVPKPRLLVLDEPDSHVDNRFEMELYNLLKELNEDMTILLVSHDIGMISPYIKTIACVNRNVHYHPYNEISEEQLKVYNCPVEIISHGTIPHRVMLNHNHK